VVIGKGRDPVEVATTIELIAHEVGVAGGWRELLCVPAERLWRPRRDRHDSRAAYSPSKAGVDALMRAIAVTYAARGVRCNAVAPGVTIVDDSPAERRREVAMKGALARTGRPEDIAAAVVFLSSPGSEYVHGQVLADGSPSARMAAWTAPAAPSWREAGES
jgi:NAD(P)-dependent dehydrogenase (short-subunit alcohol dehydrogenase family)